MASPEPAAASDLSLITTDLIVVSAVFPVLSAIAILLRFKARRVTKAGLEADDWWILATWIFTFGLSIVVWVFAQIMGIDHYKTDTLTGDKNASLCLVVESLLTQSDLTCVKIAILLFYRRIFRVKPFSIAVWLAIGAVSTWGITVFFVILFQGDPREFITKGKQEFVLDPIAVGQSQATHAFEKKNCFSPYILAWDYPRLYVFPFLLFLFLILPIHTQKTQFIFLLMEPNASIIAACLPCYAPLWGIGKDIFLRSYRSLLSLTDQSPLRRFSNHSRLADGLSSNVSQEGISQDPGWDGEAQNHVKIGSHARHSSECAPIPLENYGKIQVTRGVDIVSK
ncbi:hypothetical protein PG994_012604 [Apiospora phragmitis]|uniref:Rhodopsin domain-containing protein n=1 Tax=Apiospora phragmitis TaxID=2905665 RepID=A0ABR1TAZ8_9PEZI